MARRSGTATSRSASPRRSPSSPAWSAISRARRRVGRAYPRTADDARLGNPAAESARAAFAAGALSRARRLAGRDAGRRRRRLPRLRDDRRALQGHSTRRGAASDVEPAAPRPPRADLGARGAFRPRCKSPSDRIRCSLPTREHRGADMTGKRGRRSVLPLPRYTDRAWLRALGAWGYFFKIPDWARNPREGDDRGACPVGCEALGADYDGA